MKKILALIAALLLTGCGAGVDWFPSAQKTETEPAGTFVRSERNQDTHDWFTTTTVGVFHMYTSTRMVDSEPVTLETVRDSRQILRRSLNASSGRWEVRL